MLTWPMSQGVCSLSQLRAHKNAAKVSARLTPIQGHGRSHAGVGGGWDNAGSWSFMGFPLLKSPYCIRSPLALPQPYAKLVGKLHKMSKIAQNLCLLRLEKT